jgi:hypothetical protein
MRLAWSNKTLAQWNKALLTMATATKLVNKFCIVYGTPSLITVSNAARHWQLSRNKFETRKCGSIFFFSVQRCKTPGRAFHKHTY